MISVSSSGMIAPNPDLLKRQVLLSSMAALFTSLLYFVADFPHADDIGVISLISAFLYGLFYAFFDAIHARFAHGAGALLSATAVLLLAFVVHYSGGVASPFVFLYFCILISEAIYGLQNPVTLPLAIITYTGICAGEALGFIAPANQWAAAVYDSTIFTCILIGVTVAFMWMTRHITGLIVANLRASLERENREKEGLLKKFSDLDATAQIGALAHRIAHDLRAPLSSISGYVQLEMGKSKDPETNAVFRDMNDIVNTMSESLSCITRFGKISNTPDECIPLPEFFRQLLAIASFAPQARGVKIVKHYSENADFCVLASRSDLQQAYFNIVKNAVEAMQDNAEGKKIEVTIAREDKEIVVTIADNGPGMAPETLKNLFRRNITTKKDGTGVGLIITRDLLTRNDGSLEFHNREGGGLQAVTRLPAAC